MAAIIKLTFASLLAADSEAILPADDASILMALASYGVEFSRNKMLPYAQARLNQLAGRMRLHAHCGDMAPAAGGTASAGPRRAAPPRRTTPPPHLRWGTRTS